MDELAESHSAVGDSDTDSDKNPLAYVVGCPSFSSLLSLGKDELHLSFVGILTTDRRTD